jgi:hypothetical protein
MMNDDSMHEWIVVEVIVLEERWLWNGALTPAPLRSFGELGMTSSRIWWTGPHPPAPLPMLGEGGISAQLSSSLTTLRTGAGSGGICAQMGDSALQGTTPVRAQFMHLQWPYR